MVNENWSLIREAIIRKDSSKRVGEMIDEMMIDKEKKVERITDV